MPNAFVVDTETTGLDPKTCEVVEIALINVDTGRSTSELVKPRNLIPPETSAVHHITDEDVENARNWPDVRMRMVEYMNEGNGDGKVILIAHNAAYDRSVLHDVEATWVCTYKVAVRIFPDAPNHKNETLRYWLKLGERGRSVSQGTHSALHDAGVTYLLFKELLKHCTLEEMILWTTVPAKLPKIPFGKHVGQTWDTIPSGYLTWLVNQPDMGEDAAFCAKEELHRRKFTK